MPVTDEADRVKIYEGLAQCKHLLIVLKKVASEANETSFSEVSELKSEKAVALTRLKGCLGDIRIPAPSFRRFGKAEPLLERCGPN
jgi:hypothetical protein